MSRKDPLPYTTLHYTTLHYTTLHYTTLHYTTLHYTTLHYTSGSTRASRFNDAGDFFLDDIFSLWNATREEITQFIEQTNKHHQTIKFTAEVSETETNFLDTTVYTGERFRNESVLDVRTHFKPTGTFQYAHFATCHPSGVKRGFIKGKALRLLRTNSSKTLLEESVTNFRTHLLERIARKLYSNNPLRSYF